MVGAADHSLAQHFLFGDSFTAGNKFQGIEPLAQRHPAGLSLAGAGCGAAHRGPKGKDTRQVPPGRNRDGD